MGVVELDDKHRQQDHDKEIQWNALFEVGNPGTKVASEEMKEKDVVNESDAQPSRKTRSTSSYKSVKSLKQLTSSSPETIASDTTYYGDGTDNLDDKRELYYSKELYPRASKPSNEQPSSDSDSEYGNPHSVDNVSSNSAIKPKFPPLQQIQYRSYKQSITLYHFAHDLLAVTTLSNGFARTKFGYVYTRMGPDPLADIKVAEGDETPPGMLEAVYMPNVFQGKGCALGVRFCEPKPSDKVWVEWLCFRQSIEHLVQACQVGGRILVFDKVGFVEKGNKDGRRGVTGNWEHRAWYESLYKGELRFVKLKLTWKNKERDRLDWESGGVQIEDESEGKEMRSVVKRKSRSWPAPSSFPPPKRMRMATPREVLLDGGY
ncbi:hypothetical protein K505DRAFT_356254 [Melanomma pulvis-pyrius CBS 109.77]|uniref:Uncharacterized protein n=1 Tax=Melanomma pulvis-pyrius CBS 109.77 TaxID=1314802 RepID=A0A6A6XW24_9PLEO|nr:hypothetical protein K505DRAFT_356254 [Melanomma pulvis-pyrius CBS 109.77]